MGNPLSKKSLEQLLTDEHLSDWFKDTLRSALQRDPFEAELDAELLYSALRARRIEIERRIIDK
ncbi:MAG: hypothetical protein JNL74_00425 [Fibrobacteres bacterium]|nr:hypothetical protein [Fibrobacterota bacterium]